MTSLKLTQTGDLDLERDSLVLTEDNSDEEIEQRLKSRLKLFLGEWFLNTQVGLPYLQLIFIKGVDPVLIETVFKDEILETRGIARLLRFDPIEYNPSSRLMTINFLVLTDNGQELEVRI